MFPFASGIVPVAHANPPANRTVAKLDAVTQRAAPRNPFRFVLTAASFTQVLDMLSKSASAVSDGR
jgi:hypothetical protein